MGSIRQGKIESVIQTELASFQNNSICLGSMVTVTVVRLQVTYHWPGVI